MIAAPGRESRAERADDQEAPLHVGEPLPRHVEVREPEGLDDQPRGREAGALDHVEHGVRERGRVVEVRVARLVLDLEVHARAREPRQRERLGQRGDPRAAPVVRAELHEVGVGPDDVRRAVGPQIGERALAHLAGARRGAVEQGIVDDHRNAVLGELGVHLQHEPAERRCLEGGQGVLAVHGLAELERSTAMGVDRRADGERRRGRREQRRADGEAGGDQDCRAAAGRRHGRILTPQRPRAE